MSWRMFTVYFDPSDYPGKYVVRGSTVLTEGALTDVEPLVVVDTYDEACAAIPPGLWQLMRSPDDDIVVVEVWL